MPLDHAVSRRLTRLWLRANVNELSRSGCGERVHAKGEALMVTAHDLVPDDDSDADVPCKLLDHHRW